MFIPEVNDLKNKDKFSKRETKKLKCIMRLKLIPSKQKKKGLGESRQETK